MGKKDRGALHELVHILCHRHILLLGWFYSKEARDHSPPKPVAGIFLLLNAFGAVTSNLVGYFVAREAGQFGFLIIWAGAINSLGLLGIAFLWGYTLRKRALS